MPSYLVIARKWRPLLFEEIVGQEHVTRTLRNAVSSGRVAHAYLFSGPRGVGKTTAARILAKGLNCSNGPTPTPCNSCDSCKSVLNGSSVDVLEIDGASNNSVENIRELREGIRFLPGQGRFKVYIIDEAHMLSASAFNALLKTLEEPPPHAVFVFATTEAHKIPLTILSRCQRFDFRRIPYAEIRARLSRILKEEGVKFEDGAVALVAREADGSLRDAQSLLDQVLAFAGEDIKEAHVSEVLGLMDRSILFDLLSAVIGKDAPACLNIVEKMHNFGYDLKKASSSLLEIIRDLAVLKTTGGPDILECADQDIERLKTLAENTGNARLHGLFSIITRGYEEVSRSAHPRYSFEMALLKAASFDEVVPLDSILERLEGIKRSIGKEGDAVTGRPSGDMAAGVEKKDIARPVIKAPDVKASEDAAGYGTEKDERGGVGGAGGVRGVGGADLAQEIGMRVRSLAEPLKSASISVEGETVSITVPADKRKVFEMKKAQLEDVVAAHFKRRMKLLLKDGEKAAEKRDGADEVVKEAVRIFGARVIEDAGRLR